jgi:hypothetical protein
MASSGREGAFHGHIDWCNTKKDYRSYALPRHVHNRWQCQLEPTTVSAVLGSVERALQWAWRHTDLNISDVQVLLNCDITYGWIESLQAKGRTTKYLSNEV